MLATTDAWKQTSKECISRYTSKRIFLAFQTKDFASLKYFTPDLLSRDWPRTRNSWLRSRGGQPFPCQRDFQTLWQPLLQMFFAHSMTLFVQAYRRKKGKVLSNVESFAVDFPPQPRRRSGLQVLGNSFYKVTSPQSHVAQLAVFALQYFKLNNMLLQIPSTRWRQWKYSLYYKEESLIIFRSYRMSGPTTKNTYGHEQQYFVHIKLLKDTASQDPCFQATARWFWQQSEKLHSRNWNTIIL